MTLSRVMVRRILRAAGRPTPRRRRPPRHRSRRERMPQAGLLVQLDGSPRDWLEGRGPWLTLLAAIDDATGEVVAATFREAEDSAGYFALLRSMIRGHGLPAAIYRDRHGAFTSPITGARPRESLGGSYGEARRRRTASTLRVRLSSRRHSEQWRWTGDVRSTTCWQRTHSTSATFSHSRGRLGWGSEISLSPRPSRFSTRPAPAHRSHSLTASERLTP
jgi:hypothetical protein